MDKIGLDERFSVYHNYLFNQFDHFPKNCSEKATHALNKAFVGLKSCYSIQTERSIFKYANCSKLEK